MGSEFRETVYIAIGAMLIASVLAFFSVGLGVRDDFADTRNKQIQAMNNTKVYREFNMYNGLEHSVDCTSDISGYEVVASILKYKNTEHFEIYVDKDSLGNELYMHYTDVRENTNDYSREILQNRFDYTHVYHPMLVYDGASVKNITAPQDKDHTSAVTGIKFVRVN